MEYCQIPGNPGHIFLEAVQVKFIHSRILKIG